MLGGRSFRPGCRRRFFAVLNIGSIGWHHQSRMYVREQAHEKEEHHELEVSAEDDVEEAYTEGEAHTEAEEEEA